MSWIAQQGQAISRAVRRLAGSPVSTLLSALVIGIALALPAGGQVLLGSFLGLARDVSGTPQISLFMTLDATRAEAGEIEARLKAHADIAKLIFVSRESAAARLRGSEGLAEVLDSLPRNPFPDAFIATPKGDDPQLFERLQAEFQKLPKVEHVQLDSAWAKRLDVLIALGRQALTMLAGALGRGLVAVTFNTIRLQLLTQRDEIEVSRLLGATDAWIRRPFHWFGALQGLLGGALAGLLALLATRALAAPMAELAGLYSLEFVLRPLTATDWLVLLALCALLGWLGASASVRRHLSRIA